MRFPATPWGHGMITSGLVNLFTRDIESGVRNAVVRDPDGNLVELVAKRA